jgi:hypothetical protein
MISDRERDTTAGCHRALAALAKAFEEMNEFARTVERDARFERVTTGTDLREYRTGWTLEKYVEAYLNTSDGSAAVWWLEVSEDDRRWKTYSKISVSYGELDEDLDTRFADSVDEFLHDLQLAVSALIATYRDHEGLASEISRIINRL